MSVPGLRLGDDRLLDYILTADHNSRISEDDWRTMLLYLRDKYKQLLSVNKAIYEEAQAKLEYVENQRAFYEQLENRKNQELYAQQRKIDSLTTLLNKPLTLAERINGKLNRNPS